MLFSYRLLGQDVGKEANRVRYVSYIKVFLRGKVEYLAIKIDWCSNFSIESGDIKSCFTNKSAYTHFCGGLPFGYRK